MSSDLVDWHRIEVVQFLAASFHGRDQISLLEDGQMFANRLPCHIEALTEIAQRLTIFGPQAIEQFPPARIRQRPEHCIHEQQYATVWFPVKM